MAELMPTTYSREVGVLLSDKEAKLIVQIRDAYVQGRPFAVDFDHATANKALAKLREGAARAL